MADVSEVLPPAKRIGRPPGSRNRRTVEMVDYLLSRYTSPLEGLLAIAQARVDELAERLQCSKLEALQEKRFAWAAALPYLHQRQPLAVNLNSHKLVQLTIIDGDAPAEAAGEATISIAARLVEIEEDPARDGE
jgi:hypothetical protein